MLWSSAGKDISNLIDVDIRLYNFTKFDMLLIVFGTTGSDYDTDETLKIIDLNNENDIILDQIEKYIETSTGWAYLHRPIKIIKSQSITRFGKLFQWSVGEYYINNSSYLKPRYIYGIPKNLFC